MPSPTLGERLDAWQKRNALIVALLFLAVIVSSIITLASSGVRAYRWAFGGTSWQSRETQVISSLVAGYSLQTFEHRLGAPVFVRRRGGYTESSFQRHGYWVQALSDTTGTTVLFAVTVCSPSLHPAYVIDGRKIVLGRSTFSATRNEPFAVARYHTSGATANSNFIESLYAGNPGNYKTYIWGVDDACPSWPAEREALERTHAMDWLNRHFDYEGITQRSEIRAFRATAVLNTYAETAPGGETIKPLLRSFQVGVDRILIRTTSPDYYGQ